MRSLRDPPFSERVGEFDFLLAATVEQDISDFLRQFLPRLFDVESVVLRECADQLQIMGVMPIPAAHRTTGERKMWEGDDARRIKEFLLSEAVA
jgi:hypothetical protein